MHPEAVPEQMKKGMAELLILALVEEQPRHGYEIAKAIEERSGGLVRFRVASLYPVLARLEERALLQGRWVEKAGERRRRFYRLTAAGRKTLAAQRAAWRTFGDAVQRITEVKYA